MKLEYAIFATSALVRPENGVFSILDGGITGLIAEGLPATIPRLGLLVKASFTDEEAARELWGKAIVQAPNGDVLEPIVQIQLRPGHTKYKLPVAHFTTAFGFDGMAITMTGDHIFRVFVNDELLSESILTILVKGDEQ